MAACAGKSTKPSALKARAAARLAHLRRNPPPSYNSIWLFPARTDRRNDCLCGAVFDQPAFPDGFPAGRMDSRLFCGEKIRRHRIETGRGGGAGPPCPRTRKAGEAIAGAGRPLRPRRGYAAGARADRPRFERAAIQRAALPQNHSARTAQGNRSGRRRGRRKTRSARSARRHHRRHSRRKSRKPKNRRMPKPKRPLPNRKKPGRKMLPKNPTSRRPSRPLSSPTARCANPGHRENRSPSPWRRRR